MKRFAVCFLLLVLFGGFLSAQELPKITIVNDTGYDVYCIFVSPNDDNYWGDDLLGEEEILNNGDSVQVTLQFPLNEKDVYDMMLIDLDDDTYSKFGVQLTENARIVFTSGDFDSYY